MHKKCCYQLLRISGQNKQPVTKVDYTVLFFSLVSSTLYHYNFIVYTFSYTYTLDNTEQITICYHLLSKLISLTQAFYIFR